MLSELRARQECYQTPDWARKSIGATIDLHRTSPTYTFKCWFCWLHSFIVPVNPPDTILQPGDSPGQCWPIEGHQGQVVIGLPAEILPSCVILEHVDPGLTPAASPSSAPKEFAVFGLDVDSEEEVPLGSFTFDVQKAFLDIFLLQVGQGQHAREDACSLPLPVLPQACNWSPPAAQPRSSRCLELLSNRSNWQGRAVEHRVGIGTPAISLFLPISFAESSCQSLSPHQGSGAEQLGTSRIHLHLPSAGAWEDGEKTDRLKLDLEDPKLNVEDLKLDLEDLKLAFVRSGIGLGRSEIGFGRPEIGICQI
ncbi:sperm-associated antigen 4 protein-like isoform X1 [Lagopus muta]|uniref:sperm-associated antigen 4 protein-like isoform X1 n=1 Tax=Lagopus muta TaxID=64668 RepID=UPI00209DE3AC|nr:sperm-associated antigen 4 protein-like isoform X1 [Lagopus muta]